MPTHHYTDEELEGLVRTRRKSNKKTMKVSGKQVFGLKKIIVSKTKKQRRG